MKSLISFAEEAKLQFMNKTTPKNQLKKLLTVEFDQNGKAKPSNLQMKKRQKSVPQ